MCTDKASHRDMKKLASAMTDDKGNTMACSLRKVATKGSFDKLTALKETFADIDERVEETAPLKGEEPKPNHVLLQGLQFTMSDRATNQKNMNGQVKNWKSEVVSLPEAADSDSEAVDQANQRFLNEQVEIMNEVIPQLEAGAFDLQDPKDQAIVVRIWNFYCTLHHLVHFADVMASAA